MKFHIYTTLKFIALLCICGNLNAQAPKWLWANRTGSSANENVFSASIDPNGSGAVYTAGYYEGTVDFDPGTDKLELTSNGGFDMFITKTDSSGNLLWARSFGDLDVDYGITIVPDVAGHVYFSGAFTGSIAFDTFDLSSSGPFDMLIALLDVDGNVEWVKTIGGDGINFAQAMAVDPSGNGDVYVTGRFNGTTDFNPDTSGTDSHTASDWDIFTVKLDVSGNFEWAATAGSPAFDVAYSIAVDPTGTGDVYNTGSFRGTVDFDPDPTDVSNLTCPGNQCLFITKLDAEGDFVWAKTITSPNNIYGRSIALDPTDGSMYTTGVYNGTVDFNPGKDEFNITPNGYDIFISKLDSEGNFVWAKAMGGPGFDTGVGVSVDPGGSGDVYTIGYFGGTVDFDPGIDTIALTSKGSDDVFLTKLDKSGNFIWAKSIGGSTGDYPASVLPDLNGQVYVAGQFSSASILLDSISLSKSGTVAASTDLFISKLDRSLPTAVDKIVYQNELLVYPNPIHNELTIDVDKNEFFNVDIKLYNSFGTVCYSMEGQHIRHKKVIDVSQLPAGIYFITLDVDGKQLVSKVIKE